MSLGSSWRAFIGIHAVTRTGRRLEESMGTESRQVKSSHFRKAIGVARGSLSARHRLYRNGNKALQNGQLELAEALIGRVTNEPDTPASWIQRLGYIQERAGKYADALKTYYRAVSSDYSQSEWYYRAGVCSRKIGDFSQATELFESALTRGEGHVRAAKALAAALPNNTPGWRKLELLELALKVSDDSTILRSAASLSFSMKHFGQTIGFVERLETNGSVQEHDRILKAMSLLEVGDSTSAFTLLKSLSNQSGIPRVRKVGPGYYLDQKHDWANAFTIHAIEWANTGGANSEAAFGAAYALDRQYEWELSLGWYRRAIRSRQGDRAYWAYKYAHALERCAEYEEAANWYQRALDLGGMTQIDWFYRLGYCEYQVGAYERGFHALRCFISGADFDKNEGRESPAKSDDVFAGEAEEYKESIKAVSGSTRNRLLSETSGLESAADRALARARLMVESGDLDSSVRNFRLYLSHTSEPDRNIIWEIADVIYGTGQPAAACELLLDSREFFRPDGIDQRRFLKTVFERRMARYAEYTQRFAVDQDVVLFETYWGSKIADSPLAIYAAMREDSRYKGRQFYWSVQKDAPVPETLVDDDRTFLVEYGSRKYDRLLATAGTLVNNTSWVQYFSRRPEQRYINTWHGTPLKTVGKRIGTGVLEHANVTRNFLNVTDFMLPNEFTIDKLWADYDLSGLTQSAMVATGSPRLDRIVRGDDARRTQVRNLLGVDASSAERVVLYAPTWRGSASDKGMNVQIVRDALVALSDIEGWTVVFRAHHLAESALRDEDLNAVIAPDHIDTYDLLHGVDLLVSDYSSLLVDFLVTERPVVCFVPDLDAYRNERGLYVEPSEITDLVARNAHELRSIVSGAGIKSTDKCSESRQRFCSTEDGRAGERVLDLILEPIAAPPQSKKKTLVFFESMIPNGIRSSFLNLTALADTRKYEMKVSVDVKQVENSADRQDGLDQLPSEVGIVARIGEMAMTLEERYALGEFSRGFGITSKPLEFLVNEAYRREFRRVYGHPSNVLFVDFEGYSRFWNSLLCRGIAPGNQSGVILHNQMDRERERRFPYMAEIIRNYGMYDAIASVSSAISSDNSRATSELGVQLKQEPLVVHNTINADSIERRAAIGKDRWEEFGNASPRIVSVGRLSPEKNHTLLIESVPHLLNLYPDAELIVMGSGPSESTLRARVRDMGLQDSVHFVGFEANPMATIAHSDVFVLTSLHEGQPMVIFESMTLRTPVLTTPVPGCVEACDAGDGHVVEYDPSKIADAIAGLVERSEAAVEYDPVGYNYRALAEFDKFVASTSVVFDAPEEAAGGQGQDC